MSIIEEVKSVINKLERGVDSEDWENVEECVDLLEETYYRMLHGEADMFNEYD